MALTLGAHGRRISPRRGSADGKPLLTHMAAVAGLTAANLYIVAFGVSWGR